MHIPLKHLLPAFVRNRLRRFLPRHWYGNFERGIFQKSARVLGYRAPEAPCRIGLEAAREFLDSFVWSNEYKSYHHVHLNRYLYTLDRLPSLPRSSNVLEVGAAPYGMTLLMLRHFFDHVTTVSCRSEGAGRDKDLRPKASTYESASSNQFTFSEQYFNIEDDSWPYEPSSVDLIVACEIFEHLALDPMHAMCEANRVLRPGGWILVTVPNVLSIRNVLAMLSHRQPSIFPFYRPISVNWRHNREWTSKELATLFHASGFDAESIEAINVYPGNTEAVLTRLGISTLVGLRLLGDSIKERGETLVGIGRKTSPVRQRYPTECDLYYAHDIAQLTATDRRVPRS